jgi:hypothetical protein
VQELHALLQPFHLASFAGRKLLLMREVGGGAMELSLLPSGVPVTVMQVMGSIPGGNNYIVLGTNQTSCKTART